ncbi:hypothetical protein [Frankia sp. Cr1]|uniref:hypothetical protein n=1 Tax=Frankia sp. Cr1 TaxID=3073931 RepID=UPI002AD465D0|nr:hypothetical protein [Frankia sp. Cr1]
MASPHTDRTARQAERLAQARRLAEQAKQDHTTAWYVPFAATALGAGASFDAFGHAVGFLYALGLAIAFVVLTWGTVRLMPSLAAELATDRQGADRPSTDRPSTDRPSGPRTVLTLISTPVTTSGFLVVAAAVPVTIGLIKTVGFYVLAGTMIVFVVMGIALLVAWMLDQR